MPATSNPQDEAYRAAVRESSQLSFLYRQFFVQPTRTDVSLTGQTGIVTGSNIGLGLEASRQLLALGLSRLIVAVRSEAKGEAAARGLRERFPAATIEVWPLDLSSYESVRAFAARSAADVDNGGRLDFAVLNAAAFKVKPTFNEATRRDEVVQVNYLSTALLAILLLPVLRKAAVGGKKAGRLVIVSSETAAWAKFPEQDEPSILDALDRGTADADKYDIQDRYPVSKLLEQLFLVELAKKVGKEYVVANAVNPGFCYGSGLHSEYEGWQGWVLAVVKRLIGRSTEVGARTLVDAAVVQGPQSHGKYLSDCQIRPMPPMMYTSKGEEVARKLWSEMEKELAFADVTNVIRKAGEGVN